MLEYAKPVARLISELNKLPGIGPKTAQRLAFHILNSDLKDAEELAMAITESKKTVHFCPVCGNLTDLDPCYICQSSNRDSSVICVLAIILAVLVLPVPRGPLNK